MLFKPLVVAYNILFTISMLDQNQRYDIYTYYVLSADCTEEEEKKKEEKIPHICESIGHQPLRGNFNHNLLKQGTGTADHLTLLRLFMVRIDLIRKFYEWI